MQKIIIINILESQLEKNNPTPIKQTTKNFTTSVQRPVNDKTNDRIEIRPSCFIDFMQMQVSTTTKSFWLTRKESLFLKILLEKDKIITYSQMKIRIWEYDDEVTASAIRCFVRDIKKKLPIHTLKNYSGVGYKLILT